MTQRRFQAYRYLVLIAILVGSAACSKNSGPNSGTTPDIVSVDLTPSQTPVVQGTINGGGGAGLRCGGKLEVLDLYEARKAGLQMVATPQTKEETIHLVATRFANHYWNPESIPLPAFLTKVSELIVIPMMEGLPLKNAATGKEEEIQYVESLPLSNDYGNYEVPAGCQIEQIAYFSDEKTKLSIVKRAWDELDFLSKAILVTHEMIYMVDRREGIATLLDKGKRHTSEYARRFVGRLLAATPPPTKSDSLPTDGRLQRCSTEYPYDDATFFYAYQAKGAEKEMKFVFKTVLGHSAPYQMRATLKAKERTAFIHFVGDTHESESTRVALRILKTADGKTMFEFLAIENGRQRRLAPPQKFTCEKF